LGCPSYSEVGTALLWPGGLEHWPARTSFSILRLVDQLTPVPVAGGLRFLQLSAGARHACGVTVGNVAYCWGPNSFGRLGDGTTTDRNVPVPVAGGPSVSRGERQRKR